MGRRDPVSGRWLLRDIDLSIVRGDRIVLAGPNGSGKTLLLRSLCLLDPIDSGEILWHGRPPRNIPQFRRCVVYLHQRPVVSEGTVEDNLRWFFSFKVNRNLRFDRSLITEYLRQFRLDDRFLHKPASLLSGGETQLLALLRALSLQPEILLLDEPTAALDVETVPLFERFVFQWQREANGATVWVSHTSEQIKRVAGRVLHMENGTITREDK
ncbi:MAG: ABC transporter ATP-binding protein [Gemmatales bacterium]|nr:MAG: ABC transporter ATP-binding protein [Gemmatales bacterium]